MGSPAREDEAADRLDLLGEDCHGSIRERDAMLAVALHALAGDGRARLRHVRGCLRCRAPLPAAVDAPLTVADSGVPASLSSFANADLLPLRVAFTLAHASCN